MGDAMKAQRITIAFGMLGLVLACVALGLAMTAPAPPVPAAPRATTAAPTTSTHPRWTCHAPDGHDFHTGQREALRVGGCHR